MLNVERIFRELLGLCSLNYISKNPIKLHIDFHGGNDSYADTFQQFSRDGTYNVNLIVAHISSSSDNHPQLLITVWLKVSVDVGVVNNAGFDSFIDKRGHENDEQPRQ